MYCKITKLERLPRVPGAILFCVLNAILEEGDQPKQYHDLRKLQANSFLTYAICAR